MSVDIGASTGNSQAPAAPTVRTLARVDLRPCPAGALTGAPNGRPTAFSSALVNIERTIRANDRVCPYGVSHIAVAFGDDSSGVSPKALGERLARAVGQGLAGVLLDEGTSPNEEGRPTTVGSTTLGAVPSTTVVTVDRVVESSDAGNEVASHIADPVTFASPSLGKRPLALLLRHRTMVRYSTARFAGYGTRHDDRPRTSAPLGAVLVVDPDPRAAGIPGLATQAACALAGRLGFKARALALGTDDDLVTDIDGVGLDLVVLVVGAEPTGGRSSWSTSTWCVPAQLTGLYSPMGIDVLVVSSGATAGALAGCIDQGASVLFDLNELADELLALSQADGCSRRWTPNKSRHEPHSPLRALLKLTSSERRVLYYLTTGLAAQDIADDLVVSLATVRSHIRSILRKLEVRSQLAAVAVANSCGGVHDETSHAS